MNLLLWCFIVIIELIIIAYLIGSGFILLFSLILASPIWAAFSWPAPEQIANGEAKPKELAAEKAE